MKRRVLSLALALSLLLAMLSGGPLSAAEEQLVPVEIEEPAAASEEAIEEPTVAEEAQDDSPVVEPSVEEPLVEPADEPAEEIVEEPEVTAAPEEAQPDADAATPEPPEEEHPVFEMPVEELVEEAPELFADAAEIESADLHSVAALGSDGVEYAGVAYLSQAAFNSLSEAQQEDYVQMVDELTGMLDRGMTVEHPVFSLDEEGVLSFDYSVPLAFFADDAESEAEISEVVEEPVPAEEIVEEVAVEGAPEAAEVPEAAEPEGPIVENVELAEQYRVPIERIPGWKSPSSGTATIFGASVQNFNTLYWDGEDLFYKQLDENRKRYYDAAWKSIIDGGSNGFTVLSDTTTNAGVYTSDALSALIQTYPGMFDWMATDGGWSGSYRVSPDGRSKQIFTMDLSQWYSASREQKARNKVDEIVEDAKADAQKNYPNDIDYGIVKYLDAWLCEHSYYNDFGTYPSQASTEEYYNCHRSYGALLEGYSVCESYALAMSRLLDAAGIPNIYVAGDANNGVEWGGHAWNYVRMSDGKYYLQDTTWNDTTNQAHIVSSERYLLCADAADHKPTGKHFTGNDLKTFGFPEISDADYVPKEQAQPTVTPRLTPEPTMYPVLDLGTVDRIELSDKELSVQLEKNAQLTVKFYPETAKTGQKLTWESSAPGIAQVASNGVITPQATGQTTITCSLAANPSVKDTCQVTVVGAEETVQITSIELSQTNFILKPGESEAFVMTFHPGSIGGSFLWGSTKSEVAIFEQKKINNRTVNCITAVGIGETDIIFRASNNEQAEVTCHVKVTNDPIPASSVELSQNLLLLKKGEQQKLTAKPIPFNADVSAYSWSSDNRDVATVENGTVKAVGPGTANITCAVEGNSSAKAICRVMVRPVKVTGITLNHSSLALAKDASVQLTAKILPADADDKSLAWTSDNPGVATVDAEGNVHAHKNGDATITCLATDGSAVKATCAVNVHDILPTKIALNKTAQTMGADGDTLQLVPTLTPLGAEPEVTYSTSDADVASVNPVSGLITTGSKTGTATITAKTVNDKKATCVVTVKEAPTGVQLSETEITLAVGQQTEKPLVASLTGGYSCSGFTWSADESGAVKVEDGIVTAVHDGTMDEAINATVTATTYNGKSESCVVHVLPAPKAVELSPSGEVTLGLGETLMLTASVPGSQTLFTFTGGKDANGKTVAAIKETSDNETVKITAKAQGRTTIKAKAENGVFGECHITVVAAPKKVAITNNPRTLGEGEAWTLTTEISAKDGNGNPVDCAGAVTFSTSNKSVLDVNKDTGELTAKTAGKSAKITAKAYNGKSASVTIAVKKAPTDDAGVLKIEPAELTLAEKQTSTLAAKYKSGFGGGVKWSVVNDTGEAEIDPKSGELTAKSAGTVTAVAETYNHVRATCTVTIEPEPESVEIENVKEESITLGKGETLTLAPVAKSADGTAVTAATFTYESDQSSVVSVDNKKGKITAKAIGEANVTVTAYNGVKREIHVTVKAAPVKVTITNNPKTLGVGEAWTLGSTISATKNRQEVECAGAVTFSSSNKKVLEVDPNTGELTAKTPGKSAKITVKAYNGKSASVTIAVKAAPTEINLDKTEVTMGMGEPNVKLVASFADKKKYGHVKWESNAPQTVAVTDGALTAIAEGTATITASVYHEGSEVPYTAECEVTVKAEPTTNTMELTLPKTTLGVGEKMTASFAYTGNAAGAYEFVIDKVGKTAYATVVNKTTGEIKGAKVGTAQVYVKAYNGVKSEPKEITILAKPTAVTLLNKVTKMGVGETWQLGAQIKSGKTDVTDKVSYSYSSSKPGVVKVDPATGKLTAAESLPAGKKSASAKITLKAYSGKSASVTITVVAAPEKIVLLNGKTELTEGTSLGTYGAGESVKLSVGYEPAKSFGNVTWESDNDAIATVTNGTVTAGETPGTATITASVYNKENPSEPLTASCKIEVKPAPTAANTKLVPAKEKIGVGESVATSLSFNNAAGAVKSYKSKSTKIATVSKAGVIKGVKVGKTTITVTMYNKQEISVPVEIVKAPTKLTITNVPEGNALKVGDTWEPEFEIAGYEGSNFTGVVTSFASSKVGVAKFENGVLKAVGEGKTTITCKTYNGKSASFTLTVNAE